MKTFIRTQDSGTFSVEDENKLTFRRALKEVDLNPKEWKLIDTIERKTIITYVVARKIITLSLSRPELEEALKVACDFISKKGALPILSCARLESTGDAVTLTVTDLECYWTRTLPATGAPVKSCINANLFYSEIKALHNDVTTIELNFDNDKVTLNGRCHLITSAPDEFPETPVFKGQEIQITGLISKLKKIEAAISSDELKYNLTGAQFGFPNGKLVGTDGFRLHYEDIEPLEDVESVTIPKNTIRKMVKHGEADTLAIGEKYISYPLRGGTMVSRIIEGQFPDYMDIIEKINAPVVVEFDPKEFFKILEGVIPLADSRHIVLTINGKLSIESSNNNGKYRWQIPCKTEGKRADSYRLIYNLQFLSDAIKAYASDGPVILNLPESYGATLINGKAIVMPVRD